MSMAHAVDPVERVVAALADHGCNPRQAGPQQWSARCPAHEDRNPSLSVGVGVDGKALLNCHAGCRVDEIAQALGLGFVDLFPPRPDNVTPIKDGIRATYGYYNEHGELAYEVVRKWPKSFAQRRPDGRGGWVWSMKGVQRIPYQLPQVLKAKVEGRTIYVVEGEKDAETASWFGVTATCNSGGAGSWNVACTRALAGAAEVVIVADDDEPGHKHARAVAAAITGKVEHWRIVASDRGKDLSEHKAKGGTLEDLVELASSERAPTPDDLPAPVDWHDLFHGDRPEVEWLIEEMWPAGRLLSIVAPYKGRKSLLMLWLAACLSAGRHPWTNRKITPVRTLYGDWEMTEDDLLERLEDMGFGPDDLTHLTYYLRPPIPPLDTAEGGQALLALAQRDGAQAVILDTFVRVISPDVDENAPNVVNAFYAFTGVPFKSAGIGLARLDHTGHADKNRARGTSGKGADIDIQWVLHPTDDGIRLAHHGVARVRAGVPDEIHLRLLEDPLRFVRAVEASTYPVGTKEVAEALTAAGIPLEMGARTIAKVLKEQDRPSFQRKLLLAAQRWRRAEVPEFGAVDNPSDGLGNPPGTSPEDESGNPLGNPPEEMGSDQVWNPLGTPGNPLGEASGTPGVPTMGTQGSQPDPGDVDNDDEELF